MLRARRIIAHALLLGIVVAARTGVCAQDAPAVVEVGSEGQTSVSVAVYNDDLALVRDERLVSLRSGPNVLRFSDVAERIDPTSARLASLTAPADLDVLEQSFEYDLASRRRLLEKYIGESIHFNREGAIRPARLLGMDSEGRLTVEMDGKILLDPPGYVELPPLPEGIAIRPTLVWRLEAGSAADHTVEVHYLTGGMSWRADYTCVLDERESAAALAGQVTVANNSGATYRDAFLKLVAGDVRTTGVEALAKALPAMAAPGAGKFEERPSFEYHTYALDRRTTIADHASKQVEFLSAPKTPVRKVYEFESTPRVYGYQTYTGRKDPGRVKVILELQNKAESGLGVPLPAGTVRVYRPSPASERGVDYIGEDSIGHTPRDGTVRLYVGNAFDLTGERTVTDYKKTGADSYEEACCIKLWNHKDEDVEVTIVETFYGEWTISSPTPYQKLDASTAAFKVKVPRGKDAEVLYRARVIGG